MKAKLLFFILFLNIFIFSQNNPTLITRVEPTHIETIPNTSVVDQKAASAPAYITTTSNSIPTDEVGNTTGQLGVSLTGSATYSIPIFSAVGIKDMVPSISLVYNSQGGNGLAGFGWDINGISSIKRTATTIFHDNELNAVEYTPKDKFILDGQRLLLKSGSAPYGTNGSQYETENYSNMKIEAVGVHPHGANYGPSYFMVTYPNGNRVWYGSANNALDKLTWNITKVEDPQGNSYEYFYITDNGIATIDRIEYSKNAALGIYTQNVTQFNYTNRVRGETYKIKQDNFHRSKLLSSIEVKINNVRERSYVLTHNITPITNYQRLTEVQEINRDNKALKPIVFTYENTNIGCTITKTSFPGGASAFEGQSADFNGDGRIDYYKRDTSNKLTVYISNLNNEGFTSFNISNAWGEKLVVNALNSQNEFLSKQNLVLISNSLNATKNATIISIKTFSYENNNLTLANEKTLTVPYVHLKIFKRYHMGHHTYKETIHPAIIDKIFNGDFNGDQISESHFSLKYGITKTYMSDDQDGYHRENFKYLYKKIQYSNKLVNEITDISPFPNIFKNKTKEIVIDFNGDGKQEIMVNSGGYGTPTREILNFNASTNTWESTISVNIPGKQTVRYKGMPTFKIPLLFGDFNGDGKIDILKPHGPVNVDYGGLAGGVKTVYNDVWYYGINNGNGFDFTLINWIKYEPIIINKYSSWRQDYMVQDFNNDGKSDIIVMKSGDYRVNNNWDNDIDYKAYIDIFINTNNNVNGIPTITKTYANEFREVVGWSMNTVKPIVADINYSNGNQEFMLFQGNTIRKYVFNQDSSKDVMLRKVAEGNGTETAITYQKLESDTQLMPTGSSTSYSVSNEIFAYPYVKLRRIPSLNIVNKLTNKNISLGVERVQEYKYQNAINHITGLGLHGFQSLSKTDWYSPSVDIPLVWINTTTDIYKRGAVITENTATTQSFGTAVPSGAISSSSFAYNTLLQPNKVFINNVTSKRDNNYLKNTFATQTIQYDSYYNPIFIEDNLNNQGKSTTTAEYYNATSSAGAQYHSGRTKWKKTLASNATETFQTLEEFTYDNNLVKTVKRTGNNTSNSLLETFTYDGVGNILTKTVSEVGTPVAGTIAISPRTETFEYDATKRFIIKKTDVEGIVNSFTYNGRNGKVLTATNHLNQTSINQYDAWNRLFKETNYLGKSVTTTFVREENNAYSIIKKGEDGSMSRTLYDALNRKSIEASMEFRTQYFSNWISTKTEYDALDRPVRTSAPYYDHVFGGSTPSQWNTVQYDNYSRPIKQTSFNGKTTTITYTGLTTKVSDGRTWKEETKDALGNTIYTKDQGGMVSFTYFPNKQMKSSTYEGYTVKYEQDGWGKKTKTIDPTAGTYTTIYNILGEVQKETTPKGKVVYTNSPLGRLLNKTVTGDNTHMTVSYTYNPTSKLVTAIAGTDAKNNKNYTYAYTYNKLHQLSSSFENTTDAQYTTHFTYDVFGRTAIKEYIAAFKGRTASTKNSFVYDGYGTMYKILDTATNQSIWELSRKNNFGQVTDINLQNTKRHTNYDNFGTLTSISAYSATNFSTPIFKEDFNFNVQYGLLNSRTRTDVQINESFTYDNLNRLTSWNTAGVNNTISYDNKGRITDNPDVGTYKYTNASLPYNLDNIALNASGLNKFQKKTPQNAQYDVFNNPTSVIQRRNDEGTSVSFQMNPFFNRSHSAQVTGPISAIFKAEGDIKVYEKHYSADGQVEISYTYKFSEWHSYPTNIKFVFYINGDPYSASVIKVKETKAGSAFGGTGAYAYLHKDYLGSILAISNTSGQVIERRHFDAWGNTLSYWDNAGKTEFSSQSLIDRGYTGHEHLFDVDLIHMNARLYDPVLHKFLAPDQFIQDPTNTQNYNRFGYVLNNPLSYTDPSGNLIFGIGAVWVANMVIGAMIGAGIGMATYTAMSMMTGQAWSLGGMLKAGAIGAIQGAITAGIGEINFADAGKWGSYICRGFLHGTSGGSFSTIQGGSFISGFASGFAASVAGDNFGSIGAKGNTAFHKFATSFKGQMVYGYVSGGIASVATGGNFLMGAATGAIVSLANHWLHGGEVAESKIREKVANIAEEKLDSTDYASHKKIDNFDEKTNKCNKFVYDVTTEAGASPGTPNGLLGNSPPTAGQWATPNYKISNWKVVSSPQRGDVAAYSYQYEDASGHVSIMTSKTHSIGSNATIVRKTDFGSNPSHLPSGIKYIYRRYYAPVKGSYYHYYDPYWSRKNRAGAF